MNFFEFLIWALGVIFIGVPAVFCLAVIAVAWIDSRSGS